jgi:hypothetical protein
MVCTVVSAGLHSTGLRPELDCIIDTAVCTAVSSFRRPAPPSEFNPCLMDEFEARTGMYSLI